MHFLHYTSESNRERERERERERQRERERESARRPDAARKTKREEKRELLAAGVELEPDWGQYLEKKAEANAITH